jgi:hypothetical protein
MLDFTKNECSTRNIWPISVHRWQTWKTNFRVDEKNLWYRVVLRVARWYILKPNILIWVNFGEPLNGIFYGHLVYFLANWEFSSNLVYFPPFWYIVSRKIWQPRSCSRGCEIMDSLICGRCGSYFMAWIGLLEIFFPIFHPNFFLLFLGKHNWAQ